MSQVLDHIVELMVDHFGNYLIQKLLDRCSEQQRLEVGGVSNCSINLDAVRDLCFLTQCMEQSQKKHVCLMLCVGTTVSLHASTQQACSTFLLKTVSSFSTLPHTHTGFETWG